VIVSTCPVPIPVCVLLGHSFAVTTPKPIVILVFKSISYYSFWNFRSKTKSGSQVPLYPFWFPNRKAEFGVHYSFRNFCFQFEKLNCFSTIRFGTFAPKTKGGAVGVELSFWKSQVDFSLPVLEPLSVVCHPPHNPVPPVRVL